MLACLSLSHSLCVSFLRLLSWFHFIWSWWEFLFFCRAQNSGLANSVAWNWSNNNNKRKPKNRMNCLFAVVATLQLPTLIERVCAPSELWTPSNFECMRSNELSSRVKRINYEFVYKKNRFSSAFTQGRAKFSCRSYQKRLLHQHARVCVVVIFNDENTFF